jgi:hypothetical protein
MKAELPHRSRGKCDLSNINNNASYLSREILGEPIVNKEYEKVV